MADQKNPQHDQDVEALIQQFQSSDLHEFHIKTKDFDLFLSRDPDALASWSTGGGSLPPPPNPGISTVAQAAPVAAPVTPPTEVPDGYDVVRAPYLGTFYRAPKPGEPNFVELGQIVEAGEDLCLVEVMKLFTAICAGAKGVVRQVFAVDGQMVEEGAPLFALEPVA
jgi:acetyl-CoA carboxylase biotin carboxyl carrier protein